MKRVPFTERAKQIALKQLEAWNYMGFDTTYILDESTLKGWRGLFVNERTPRLQAEQPKPSTEQILLIEEGIQSAERGARQRFMEKYKQYH